MPKDIYLEGEDIKFVDGVQIIPRKLDEIVKGDNSAHASRHAIAGADAITELGAHKTRHQDTGADEISVVGLSGLLADSQTPLSHKVSHQNGGADEIDITGLSGLLANDVELEEIGTATYDDIQNWINNIQSAGYVSGGLITATSPADGTIAISAVKGFLKITDSDIGVTKSFDLAGTASFALTNNQSNYIYVDYNDGTPKFNVTTTRSDIELNRQFTLGRVYRKDDETHIVNSGAFLTNHVRNTHERLVAVRGFERATGGVTSETGERYLYVTAGTFYLGQNKATTSLVDTSGTDTFTRYYHTASVWTSDVKSQIAEGGAGFYKYDNGTDLVNLSNNKYGVFWVFIHFDGDLHVIVGRGDYTLAEAQGANVPAIPNGVNDFATLIAKIILLEDGTNFTSVETAYEQFFPYSSAVNHNDLGIIQGGGADDYYHLTNAQLTEALLFAQNGWIASGETWTYASTTTFTISGDLTGKYQIGDKIKLTQTTAKYFYVIGVSYSAPNTTITITGGIDYTLADAAITSPFYSKIENPQGFTTWFNYTPTYSAGGSMTYTSVTTMKAIFAVIGKMVKFKVSAVGTTGGTANPAIYVTLPLISAETAVYSYGGSSYVVDNADFCGTWVCVDGSKISIVRYDGANWGLGSNRRVIMQGFYRIA